MVLKLGVVGVGFMKRGIKMKKLTLLLTLIFSMMFSSTAFAEWTKVSTDVDENDYYVDFDRIRKNDGFIYYWSLTNYLEPTSFGDLSTSRYSIGDCKSFRLQILSFISYKQAMGKGIGRDPYTPTSEWDYPIPGTSTEKVLNSVCDQ